MREIQTKLKKVQQIRTKLLNVEKVSKEKSVVFFKTGLGDYAEHDIFIGVTVPNLRKIAKEFSDISIKEIYELIQSKINEERFLAIIILVNQFKHGSSEVQKNIYNFYFSNLDYVNNWNLVDVSCHYIIGAYLFDKDRTPIFDLAKSPVLWKRRCAIVSTWYFIRKNDLSTTFKLAEILLCDNHDLIHKAVGWMLREAGKRSEDNLVRFLNKYASKMPRTMLRYAIEKFSEDMRQKYLRK